MEVGFLNVTLSAPNAICGRRVTSDDSEWGMLWWCAVVVMVVPQRRQKIVSLAVEQRRCCRTRSRRSMEVLVEGWEERCGTSATNSCFNRGGRDPPGVKTQKTKFSSTNYFKLQVCQGTLVKLTHCSNSQPSTPISRFVAWFNHLLPIHVLAFFFFLNFIHRPKKPKKIFRFTTTTGKKLKTKNGRRHSHQVRHRSQSRP